MQKSVIPWSYSSLTGFENCPFQVYEVKITGHTPRKEYKESSDGISVHKQIETYCKGTEEVLPENLKTQVDRVITGLDPAFFLFEHKLAITQDRTPAEWWTCYHRGVIDVLHVEEGNPVAHIFDWKTGKVDEYSQQLKANAICVFAHFPFVQEVRTSYVWLKFNKETNGKVYREFADKIWQNFETRVGRMKAAEEKNEWPKKPSGLCKRHCPVTTCEHNGSYEQ